MTILYYQHFVNCCASYRYCESLKFKKKVEFCFQAGVYFDEKNLETSYIYYAKFIV